MSGRSQGPGQPFPGEPWRDPRVAARRPVGVIGAPIVASGPVSDAALVAPIGMRGPGYLFALQQAEGAARIAVWVEIGDALGQVGRWDRARIAWERGLTLAEASPETRNLASTFYWRLGQLCEGTAELTEAGHWYERAADSFRKEGALADEAMARMALARVVYHARGGGEARQHARDAVLAAREAMGSPSGLLPEAGPEARANLLGEALEMSGEVSLDLGHFEEAIASFREAVKQHERARLDEGAAEIRSSDEVRATIALAEALLDSGQVLAAVKTYESVEGLVEGHELAETRGRGMGLLGIINLELGQIAEAAEPLKKAHEALDAAGALFKRARLFVATAQRIEQRVGPEEALSYYEKAWIVAQAAGDELRLAPIGYALARCFVQVGDWVRADAVIEKVLTLVQSSADLEGLVRCTELAVRIALKLAQGKLALDRLMLLARTRGRLGDKIGEVRSLRTALAATLAVPGLDPDVVAGEFMECLRQVGTSSLGPAEAMQTAEAFSKGDYPQYASEIALMEAERHLAEGRRSEAARTFVKAAVWSVRAHDRWAAVDLWDRAVDLGQEIGMPEVEQWAIERTIASEG